VKRRGDGRCPGTAGLGSPRRPAAMASVVVAAGSAVPFGPESQPGWGGNCAGDAQGVIGIASFMSMIAPLCTKKSSPTSVG
jgi:hypothetical protein